METISLKIAAKAHAQMIDANVNLAMVIDTLVSTKKVVTKVKTRKIKRVKALSKSGVMINLVVQVNNRSNNHMTVLALGSGKTKTKAKDFTVSITLTEADLALLHSK